MTIHIYDVTGMSCGHCEAAILAHVTQVPSVTGVEVSAQSGRLTVTADGRLDDSAVLAAVDEAGYDAVRS